MVVLAAMAACNRSGSTLVDSFSSFARTLVRLGAVAEQPDFPAAPAAFAGKLTSSSLSESSWTIVMEMICKGKNKYIPVPVDIKEYTKNLFVGFNQ